MRVSTAVSLFVSSMALVACGGTAEETLNVAGTNNNLCGLQCPTEALPQTDDRNAVDNTGNDESISEAEGDTTLILEQSVIKNLKDGESGYSELTEVKSGQVAKSAVIAIDTNTSTQSGWPKPKEMTAYLEPKKGAPRKQGLGGVYTEYRALTRSDTGTAVDEELQVWRWNHSYGTQYRNVSSGGEATHQAWSFGGTRTASAKIPTSGKASYAGAFGSTAKTANFVEDPDGSNTLSVNNIWRVTGTSASTVDFASGSVSAVLDPTSWEGFQTRNGAVGFLKVNGNNCANNCFGFMNHRIFLKGKLTKDTKKGNSIAGRSTLEPTRGYVSGGNGSPFYGALFGPSAEEISGVFNVEAINPDPVGPDPINDDRRGFVNHSGVFNGKKQ